MKGEGEIEKDLDQEVEKNGENKQMEGEIKDEKEGLRQQEKRESS